MSLFAALFGCCGLGPGDEDMAPTATRVRIDFKDAASSRDSAQANELVDLICQSEKLTTDLQHQLRTALRAESSWTASLARAIHDALSAAIAAAIAEGRAMSPALQEAVDRAADAAEAVTGFVHNHPVMTALIVLGVLVLLMPWVIELLGFAAEGPVAESFAAAWQARYAGYVPKGSLFSFFQRLGMKGF